MKKLKLFFTALLLLCCVGTATAQDFKVGGIYYNILSGVDKTVEVTYYGTSDNSYYNKYTGSVVIPESVTYNGTTYSITSIGDSAFFECSSLTSITIPNSVTSIGDGAFSNCGLTSITIPNSVTSIGYKAFNYCYSLRSVTIGNSVTSIGSYAFAGTAWYNNQPDGVVYAGKVLYGYKGTMPENTSIIVKEGTLGISDSAFSGCSGLTSITIPNSVASIGRYAFYECTGLTSIEIPNSVTSIGDYAFYKCTGLKEVHISDLAAWCGIDFTFANANPLFYAENLYLNDELITELTIPNSVTSIGDYAFYNYSGLTSIVIPNSVTSIGNYAFQDCSGPTSIVIPNSVTSIGFDAFDGCTGLRTVYNFSNLTFSKGSGNNGNIAYYADKVYNAPNGFIDGDFIWYANEDGMTLAGYLGNATELTLPADYKGKSVISIGNSAFYGCTGLTSITIPNSVTSIGSEAFFNCTGLTSITIPNSVTSIGSYAFYGCTGLTSIEIPNSVTSIGIYAFSYCSGLTSIEIPNSVTSIGGGAFSGCSGLTSITIPNSVTSIGERAFSGCTGLASIVIPNSVTSIGVQAFYNCSGLKTVINFSNFTFSKGSEGYGYIAHYADKVYNVPNGSVEGDFIFGKPNDVNTLLYYLGNATELTLPANYKGGNYAIGAAVFQNYTGLATELIIHNNITGIGASAFKGCNNIEKLYIGSSVESIGDKAFAGCEKITEIKVALEKPIRGNADIFADAVYDNATLYIPNGTEQLYQKREPWNLFFYIAEMDFTGIDEVYDEIKGENRKVKTIYDLQGRKVEVPSEGIYIINGKKVLVK